MQSEHGCSSGGTPHVQLWADWVRFGGHAGGTKGNERKHVCHLRLMLYFGIWTVTPYSIPRRHKLNDSDLYWPYNNDIFLWQTAISFQNLQPLNHASSWPDIIDAMLGISPILAKSLMMHWLPRTSIKAAKTLITQQACEIKARLCDGGPV